MIIKEEGLEALADQASSDSGQYREEPGQDNDDDPDYQVLLQILHSFNVLFSVCRFFFYMFFSPL